MSKAKASHLFWSSFGFTWRKRKRRWRVLKTLAECRLQMCISSSISRHLTVSLAASLCFAEPPFLHCLWLRVCCYWAQFFTILWQRFSRFWAPFSSFFLAMYLLSEAPFLLCMARVSLAVMRCDFSILFWQRTCCYWGAIWTPFSSYLARVCCYWTPFFTSFMAADLAPLRPIPQPCLSSEFWCYEDQIFSIFPVYLWQRICLYCHCLWV